jgi:hypothetical protein
VAPMIVTTHTPYAKSKRSREDAIAKRVTADEGEGDQKVTPPASSAPPTPAPPPPAPVEPTARASARVAYDSHLSGAYRLQRLRMLIDGVVAYDAPAAGSVQTTPGDHVVEVIANYRINDPIFTYVGDYGVELRSTQIIAPTATPVVFVATATPKGNATTPIGQRAGLAWRSFPEREPIARP